VIAELCWSDDPEYTAGYVASPKGGYLRIPQLKARGDIYGGRAFFLAAGSDPLAAVNFLEQTPFLVTDVGHVRREEI
jgi:6-carboxyhexanoate--CoA ligase